jgi:hypothetical protein
MEQMLAFTSRSRSFWSLRDTACDSKPWYPEDVGKLAQLRIFLQE